jgi:hypothetical protein
MPYRDMPWVRQGQVVSPRGERIALDTPAWFAWLEGVSSFCYSSLHSWMRLTVRCEKRRRQCYWYGYSRIDCKLHNIYLGKLSQLTQARLEQACQHIYQQASKEVTIIEPSQESTNAR